MNKKRELVKARKLTLKHLLTLVFITNNIPKFMDLRPSTIKKMGYKNLVKFNVRTSEHVEKLTKNQRMWLFMARRTGKSTLTTGIVDSINYFLLIKNTFYRLGVYKNETARHASHRKRLVKPK